MAENQKNLPLCMARLFLNPPNLQDAPPPPPEIAKILKKIMDKPKINNPLWGLAGDEGITLCAHHRQGHIHFHTTDKIVQDTEKMEINRLDRIQNLDYSYASFLIEDSNAFYKVILFKHLDNELNRLKKYGVRIISADQADYEAYHWDASVFFHLRTASLTINKLWQNVWFYAQADYLNMMAKRGNC